MQLSRQELQKQILSHLHTIYSAQNKILVSPIEIQQTFLYNSLDDIMISLRSLNAQGYVKPLVATRNNIELPYRLTELGHQVGDYICRTGEFPNPPGFSSNTKVTYNPV